jgi:hypothetical protein
MKARSDFRAETEVMRPGYFRRVAPSAFVCVASLGIWLPRTDAATLVNIDLTRYPLGPTSTLTNTGTLLGDFTSVGTVVPGVSNVDGIHAVAMLDVAGTAGAGGQQYAGPQVPAALGGANKRTVEAWIFDPGGRLNGAATPNYQFEKTIFSFGRRTGSSTNGNFVLEHGISEDIGAVSTSIEQSESLGGIGWNGWNNVTTNNWTYIVATYDGTTLSVYADGLLKNSETYPPYVRAIDTTLVSNGNGNTNTLMRIARQTTDSGTTSGTGIGPFYLGRLRVQDTNMTAAQVLAQYNAEKAAFNYKDSDSNGMADWWEIRYFGAIGQNPSADPDGDGLTNLQEYNARTNPLVADTDGDGLTDGYEVNVSHTDPTNPDTDGDGLSDGYEVHTSLTNPLVADTDGDGFSDGVEVAKGTDPRNSASFPAALVNLDATSLPLGPLPNWTNNGTIGGTFDTVSATNPPAVSNIFGIRGVNFTTLGGAGTNGTSYLGPVVPTQLTGNGARTIEAWVYNSTIQEEETMFAWGARDFDRANVSFGEGRSPGFGACLHWGASDIGWNNQEVYGRWVNLAYTYDGTNTTRVYVDGKLANTDLDSPALATQALDSLGQPYHFRMARQNAFGQPYTTIDGTGFGEFTISRVRVYDVGFDGATLQAHFNAEKGFYGLNDTDGDGMPDWFEDRFGLNKNDPSDANQDPDGDGLTNLQEYKAGYNIPTQYPAAGSLATIALDPHNPDTDNDLVSDGAEVNRTVGGVPAPSNPFNKDTDFDGLPDGVETGTGLFICASDTGTDPTKVDTDGDGDSDWEEVNNNTDPTDPNSFCHCYIADGPPPPPCPLNLDATKLPLGPLNTWGNFVVPTNATPPAVVLVDSVRAVEFQLAGGTGDGTQFLGPEAYPTANGDRTVEAWIRDPSPQSEKTIFAWGRRGGFAPEGKNFALGHGTNATSGALSTGGSADLGWADKNVFGRWTYLALTVSNVLAGSSPNLYRTNLISAYVDGQLASSQTNTLSTAAFAADAPNSSTDSTNRLHFRIGRQNTDIGDADTNAIGAFHLAKLRIYNYAIAPASIQHRFEAERKRFLPPLRIDDVRVDASNGDVVLSWAAGPGRSVSIESSTDLTTWSLIASNLTGTGYTDSPTNSVPGRRFFRLRTP